MGADMVLDMEGNIGTSERRAGARDLGVLAPPGSEAVACMQGLSRNLGDLAVSGVSREQSHE